MRITYKPKYERLRQHERAILIQKQKASGKRTPKEAIKALPAAQIIWALRAHVKALLIDFNRLPLEYRNLKIEDGIKDKELEAIYGLWLRVEKEKNELEAEKDAELAKLNNELKWDQEIREDLASGVLDYYSGENMKIRELQAEIIKLKELIYDFRASSDEPYEGERCKNRECPVCQLLERADKALGLRPPHPLPYHPVKTRYHYHTGREPWWCRMGFAEWYRTYWRLPSPDEARARIGGPDYHQMDAFRAWRVVLENAKPREIRGLIPRVWARRRLAKSF
jgi:hypothetical protein